MQPKSTFLICYFVLGILQCIIAIGAIPAGIFFLVDPSGHQSGTSIAILVNSPFSDFFVPGLFLLIFNGIGNLLSAIVSFFKIEVSGVLGIVLGLFLILWVVLQVYWIGLCSILQPVYFIFGGVEAFLGYKLLRNVIKAD